MKLILVIAGRVEAAIFPWKRSNLKAGSARALYGSAELGRRSDF